MKTDNLIRGLTEDLVPVKPASLYRQFLLLLSLAGVFFLVLVLGFKSRSDIEQAMQNSNFLDQQLLLVSISVVSILLFCRVLFPDRGISPRQTLAYALLLSITVVSLLVRFFSPSAQAYSFSAYVNATHCASIVVVVSLMLSAVFLWSARSFATIRPALSAILGVIATVTLSSVAVDLACPNDHPMHLLFFHLLVPAAVALGVCIPLYKKMLRW